MKKKEWATPNRMLMQSGHRTFDRQTNCISTGNVIANTQISFFIRPFSETKTWAGDRPPGHLQNYDMEKWREWGLPRYIDRYITDRARTESVILYRFHHWNGDRRIVHGYIVTRANHVLMRKFVTGPTWKSQLVIDECAQYVSEVGEPDGPEQGNGWPWVLIDNDAHDTKEFTSQIKLKAYADEHGLEIKRSPTAARCYYTEAHAWVPGNS